MDHQESAEAEGIWEYPMVAAVIKETGFEGIGVYIARRKNTVAQYIATRLILDLCEQHICRPIVSVYWRWWYQEGIDLLGGK